MNKRDNRGHDKESKFHSASRKVSVNVVHGNQSRLPGRSNGAGNRQCEFCTLDHTLWMCPGFSKESVEKRWIFAKEKHLCFNCLGSHFAKSCKSRGTCNTCRGNHHTLLHREPRKEAPRSESSSMSDGNGAGELKQVMSVAVKAVHSNEVAYNNSHGLSVKSVPEEANVTTNARERQVRLRVVPVKVWGARKGLVETYAFLDEGSDITLCTEGLLDKLKLRGEPVQVSLATINGIKTRAGRRVSLSTQGVDENAVIQLSNVISVPTLPELQSSIPSNKDVSKYQEVLKGITFPELEGGIELLIGADVPGAHRTLEYRMNHSGGPNAVRSALGWGLVGPVDQCKGNSSLEVSHVNLVQSERLELNVLKERTCERDFIGKKDAADLGPSVEDKRALQVMEESVVKENGHYQNALPWKSTSASSTDQWRHVGTADSSADVASRGQMPDQLLHSEIWFNGPPSLWLEEDKWPTNPVRSHASDFESPDIELIKCHQTSVTKCRDSPAAVNTLDSLLNHFSKLTKLKRAVAWLARFTKIVKAKLIKTQDGLRVDSMLNATELKLAELDIIKLVQQICFASEMALLKKIDSPENMSNSSCALKGSRLRKLSPVLMQGILRVGGRLHRSSLPECSRHPIILPSAHHVTTLIVRCAHAAEGHAGPLHTLAKVREKYWIVKGHATVRKVINDCRGCRASRASHGEQLMAPLPSPRVSSDRPPFASCRVDFAGPYLTRVGRRETKRYICLFTCLATRAVHLECAFSLDVDSFLLAFTRFINRRSSPEEMWSDNGSNFVGASRELRESVRDWNRSVFQSDMARRGVKWRFNPPAACHHGGVWERLVRSVKRVLSAITKSSASMTDETFITFLTEVERILNGRPLTSVSSDPRDLEALTPNHLLCGVADSSMPLGKFLNADGYRRAWRKASLLADQFWSRWLREYVPTLQLRQKWLKPKRNLQVGDMVLVADESTTRDKWPKGIVEETFADKDGLVRSVRLRTAKSPSLLRDIRKLCLLEAVDN